ncbi:MAG: hypothetical protein ACLFUB_19935 [Cyclobacteriaceae bacterium]
MVELRIANETGESRDEVTITAEAATTPPPVSVIIDGDITEDRVLENIIDDPEQADYIVTTLVNVGAKLTIQTGVKVVFEEDKGLTVQSSGKIIANGTAYKVEDEVVVLSGIKIAAGTPLGFNPDKYLKIIQEGYLNAKGTNSEPIRMKLHAETNHN